MNTRNKEIYMTFTCGGIQYEIFEHFINHHIAMGIKKENIYFCYHQNTDMSQKYDTIWQNIFKKINIKPKIIVKCEFDTPKVQLQPLNAIKKMIPIESWLVRTDTDAFIELPYPKNDIVEFCNYLENNNYTHAIATCVDRLSYNCSFDKVNYDSSIFQQFPIILKDHGRIRELAKLLINGKVKKNKNNVLERPKQSLVFVSKNFIQQTKSVHHVDQPEDPNLSRYVRIGLLHHFKFDNTYILKHKNNDSIIGKKYDRTEFSKLHEIFFKDQNSFCFKKLKKAYKHQIEPKSIIYNPNFPSFICDPKWI